MNDASILGNESKRARISFCVAPFRLEVGILDFSPFLRLVCVEGQIRRRHEFTHCIHENRTAHNSKPLGLTSPGFDRLLWLSRNAPAFALLPATTTLRQKTDSLPRRSKPDQPAPPSAFREWPHHARIDGPGRRDAAAGPDSRSARRKP